MELSVILSDALSGNEVLRKQAEANIEQITANNYGEFLLELAKELALETRAVGIRQIASTLIKNLILYSPNHHGKWKEVDKQLKNQIKNTVLSTLASNNGIVRKAAAIAVSAICKIDIPANEWNDIIEILCQTSQNQDRNIKISSIITLNYIAQELTPKDISESDICNILNIIYILISTESDEEVIEVTINAFSDYIPYSKKNFENKNQKDILLGLIYSLSNHSKEKIRFQSVQLLLDICRNFYDLLEDNINDILTISCVRFQDTESIAILTYEIWCSICDIEIARNCHDSPYKSKGYCNRYYNELLKAVFAHIVLISDDEDKWSYSKASCCLLSVLSQCCESDLLNKVYSFIGENMNNQHQVFKESAILAFGAILETNHKESLTSTVMKSIDTLLEFLCSESTTSSLRDSSAWVLERIAELYGSEFNNNIPLLERLYENIIFLILNSKRKIVLYLLNSLHFLYRGLRPLDGQNSTILSKYVKDTLDLLLKLAFNKSSYDCENNVTSSSFFVISSILEYSAPDTKIIISSFFEKLIEAFKSTFDESYFSSNSMKRDYQAYLAINIQSVLISGYVSIDQNKARELLSMIIQTFNERNSIYDEGLMLCSSIALNIGSEFDVFMNDFINYLIYALNSHNEISLCTTAINVSSDLIRALYTEFNKYIDKLLPQILNILSDFNADKSFKPYCLNVISDFFVSCNSEEKYYIYFGQIMNLLGNAIDAATHRDYGEEDWDNAEYFDALRENLVECLTCVFHYMKTLRKENEFESYVLHIVQFLQKINEKEYYPSAKVIKYSLSLIADFCESYKGKLKNILNVILLEEMIMRLKNSKMKKLQKIINWVEKSIKNEISYI